MSICRKNEVAVVQHMFLCIFSEMDPNLFKAIFSSTELISLKNISIHLSKRGPLTIPKHELRIPNIEKKQQINWGQLKRGHKYTRDTTQWN